MKNLFYTFLTILFLTASLVSCGPEGGDHSFDNPYDSIYNDQPETSFINISSPSKRPEKAERNSVTLIWDGMDNDGNIVDYSYKMDDDQWLWTSDSFIEYTSLATGSHLFYVKARDNVGAIDLTSAEISFEVDATPPSVSFTAPFHNASGVAVNSAIVAVFSEPLDRFTLISSTFTLKDDFDNPVPGIIDYTYTTATFTPYVVLDNYTKYWVTATTGVTDEVGNVMVSGYSWSFITAEADNISPEVSSTNPTYNATGVAIDSSITATFSEQMAAFSVSTSTFKLEDDYGFQVDGTVSHSGATATFTPVSSLSYSTSYTAIIRKEVTDLAGNALNDGFSDYSWSFTSGLEEDTTAPEVSSTTPKNSEVDVAANSLITVIFSEPVTPSTVTTASFKLSDGSGDNVPGSVYYSGTTAAFTPHTTLDYSSSFTARITTDVMDASGNPITSDYFWSFATGPEPDTTPPTVSSTTPKHNATGIAINSAITATFSELMDAYTISTATFLLEDQVSPIEGSVTYSGTTVTFTPHTSLDFSSSYTATISTDMADIEGNNLSSDYLWNFTTGDEPDNTPPVVMWTSPFDNATGVDIETVVTATFSEPVDLSTVTTSTFKLKDNSKNPVSGNVSLNGTSAIFSPYTSLFEDEAYTVRITTGVRDSAGNSLVEDYIWNFTTGIVPDLTPPTVSSIIPFDNATNVPYDTSVIITFSEPLDSSTINTDSLALYDEGALVYVDGNVYYDGDLTAIFTPLTSLSYDTLHRVELTTDIKDVAGNPLLNYSSTFTTSSAPDITPPEVLLTVPFTGETDVPVDDPRIFITFNEPMDASTITTDTIELFNENTMSNVTGNVYFDGVLTALFKPLKDLAYDTAYTIIVKAGVSDLAGNVPISDDNTRVFTTGLVPINIASSVSGGSYHSLAIKNDLTAWAWGENIDGQLGDSSTSDRPTPVQVSVISEIADVTALAAGDAHSIALLDDETVWTWGDNVFGQLGIGSFDTEIHSTPTQVPGLSNIIAVAAGLYHSLALRNDGTVWTWGDNYRGQLGDDTTDDKNLPVKVVDLGDPSGYLQGVVAIAAGEDHSIAIKSDGTVWAWGWNNTGQLGDGTADDSSVPVQVSGLSNVVAVAAGDRHAVALKSDGTVWSWGWNIRGQLGDGTNDDSWIPVWVEGMSDVESLSAGSLHTIALGGGNVWAWGMNSYGQLGNGTTTDSNAPVQVSGLSGVTAIAGGYLHSLALKGNGTAWGWGDNSSGQLGYDTTPDDYSSIPGKLNW